MAKPLVHDIATPPLEPVHTTLYDLIAAMQDVAESPEDQQVITAAAIHVLNTHRVTCEGRLKGARFVAEGQPDRSDDRKAPSQFDKIAVSF